MARNLLHNWCFCIITLLISSACSQMEYVDNHTLSQIDGTLVSKQDLKTPFSTRQLGGLVFRSKNDDETTDTHAALKEEKHDERVFLIKRDKQKIMAETLLFDNTNVANSTFKKSYFSFGADRKRSRVGFEFRFVY